MEGAGVWREAWSKILTVGMLEWMMDVGNPLRVRGVDVAHYATVADVMKAVDTYMQSLHASREPKADELHLILFDLRNVYELAV